MPQVDITLHNADSVDLFVRVWDLNQVDHSGNEREVTTAPIRLNQEALVNVRVEQDSDSNVHIRWWVQDIGDPERIGEGESDELATDVST